MSKSVICFFFSRDTLFGPGTLCEFFAHPEEDV